MFSSNWNSNPYYMNQSYQESAKPEYTNFTTNYEQTYNEEQEFHDYTFLPKPTFYETLMNSPLDLTRKTTDVTDYDDVVPPSYTSVSPNFLPSGSAQLQSYNSQSGLLTNVLNGTASNAFHTTFISSAAINESQPKAAVAQVREIQIIPESLKFEDHGLIDYNQQESDGSPVQASAIASQHKALKESKIWDEEKDEMLSKLGTQYKCDWKKIAKRFNHKKITPHFLKIRYKELTSAPLQRRMKFDHKDDLMIAKYFERYGSNWTQMATHFKNRSPIMLKNRYYSYIRKRDLIETLIQEVKDYEKDNILVDDMREQGSEGSVHNSNNQEAAYDMESVTDTDNMFKDNDSANHSSEKRTPLNLDSHLDHMLVSSEKDHKINKNGISLVASRKGSKITKKSRKSQEAKRIQLLEAKVKSFKGLYLQTFSELKSLKSKLQQN